eukprot:m.240531 g.240531  ORF g.240531 m.240531 type:complete len:172 (+) comp13684_c0_seq1:37-552(+)
MEALAKLDELNVEKLLHEVIDGLSGRAGPRFTSYAKEISLAEWHPLHHGLEGLLAKILKTSEFDLPPAVAGQQKIFKAVVAARQDELKKVLARNGVTTGSTRIEDFDWNVKMALASDKISSIQQPLLHLLLKTKSVGGAGADVNIELDAAQLARLIETLEAAQQAALEVQF